MRGRFHEDKIGEEPSFKFKLLNESQVSYHTQQQTTTMDDNDNAIGRQIAETDLRIRRETNEGATINLSYQREHKNYKAWIDAQREREDGAVDHRSATGN